MGIGEEDNVPEVMNLQYGFNSQLMAKNNSYL
jgi:hypothetical protein